MQACAQLGRSLLENSGHPIVVDWMKGTWQQPESRLQLGFSSLELLPCARSHTGREILGFRGELPQGVGSMSDTGKAISSGP